MKTLLDSKDVLRSLLLATLFAILALPVSAKNEGDWSASNPKDEDVILPSDAVNALLQIPWLIEYYHGANPIRLQGRFVPKAAKLRVDKTPVVIEEATREPQEDFARLEITAVERVSTLRGYAVSFRYPPCG